MKKGLRVFKNVFLSILFIGCILTLILSSCLTLNRNEYGYTQFGDKILIVIDNSNNGNGYKKGQLAIIQKKKLIEFDGSDEIFIYNTENDKVSVSHSKIIEINKAGNKAIVFLENGRELTTDDIVVGEKIKLYSIGTLVSFLQSKWGFISALILCFMILVYLAISIFYGKSKEKINNDEKFVVDENSMDDAAIATIVEASANEPAKVKSDDFISNQSNKDILNVEDDVVKNDEVVSSEGVDATELEPIILEDVNKKVVSNNLEELVIEEDDDIELI